MLFVTSLLALSVLAVGASPPVLLLEIESYPEIEHASLVLFQVSPSGNKDFPVVFDIGIVFAIRSFLDLRPITFVAWNKIKLF